MGIFKYYSPQDYNFVAFCKNQIFFSRPSNLNDPFDTASIIISSYKKFCRDIHWNATGEKNLDKHGICSFSRGNVQTIGIYGPFMQQTIQGTR